MSDERYGLSASRSVLESELLDLIGTAQYLGEEKIEWGLAAAPQPYEEGIKVISALILKRFREADQRRLEAVVIAQTCRARILELEKTIAALVEGA